ncbi:mediator of RNA polymerase II transcription subunit 20a-like [Solanum lycopersicum]|uniref:mediator of RNA polymerase II transcription subunit 20a-like n=1 Tax=Solanum lycopersicum TaxID=4081 RepID=UPI000E1DFBD0|nr:mediator of RNA polymerase II transcription subunit 20a-like [Solanum lycopersicum]
MDNMSIKWVLCWQPNAGTTINSQILIEVSNCVESINGVKEGGWKNTFCFYKPMLKEQENESQFPQQFLGASLQEQPDKFYMALSRKRLIAEEESSIQTIMENLQSYRIKFALNCEGFLYRLGDFRVRVGKVVPINSENLRGIVMEFDSVSRDCHFSGYDDGVNPISSRAFLQSTFTMTHDEVDSNPTISKSITISFQGKEIVEALSLGNFSLEDEVSIPTSAMHYVDVYLEADNGKCIEEFDCQHKLSPFPFAFAGDFLTVTIPVIVILLPGIQEYILSSKL